jgi:hypothetical protein
MDSNSSSRKKYEEVVALKIRFLGEQDGPPERFLKSKLAEFFRRDGSVNKSYLAKVSYGEGKNAGVILGLQTQFGPDKGMVEKIGAIFAVVFNPKEHLDIVFLTDSQEAELSKVCKPFFQQNEDRSLV